MKKIKILTIICLSILSSTISAQQYAIDKKATIILGSGSFMSQGGDLFEDLDGNKATAFTFTPSIYHFITKNFYIGGSLEFTTESQGDYSFNGVGIGPGIGYAIGGPQSQVFPYFELGMLYYKMNADYGTGDDSQFAGSDIYLGFGVIIPIKEHIGLIFGSAYHMIDLKDKDFDDNYSGNVFSIAVGIAGLIFQNAD
ncbi:MAG: hypothetical protein KFF49_03320 [Bacteroidales bacterium]|nr:hypothetical protein [Bacteroidales bacterium]